MTVREALKLYPEVRGLRGAIPGSHGPFSLLVELVKSRSPTMAAEEIIAACDEVLSTLAEAYYGLAGRDREDERAIVQRARDSRCAAALTGAANGQEEAACQPR